MRHLTVIFVLVVFAGLGIGITPTIVMSDTKNKTVLFAEDVNKDDNHWRLVLTKNGNQVKLETTLLRCNTCTSADADLSLTMDCKSTTLDPENQFVSWCKDSNFALRKMKGNLKKVSLWDSGNAGGAEFEFISSNQIAKYKSFVEKTGLSSTRHFVRANIKTPMPETNMAEEEERRRQALAETKRKAEEEKRRLKNAETKHKAEEEKRRLKNAETKRKAEEDKIKNPDAIAVIIGNLDYEGRTPDVDFAGNDADAMRKFVLNKLGYRPGNIINLRDAERVLKEINERLGFLKNVGLDYLSLSRNAGTLSGGESQRIRLASQIGSGLTGVLYVLDEPSIGLHQRDNDRLLATLNRLKELGNTVIVVEHDEDAIRSADFVVDMGPKAGVHGDHRQLEGLYQACSPFYL